MKKWILTTAIMASLGGQMFATEIPKTKKMTDQAKKIILSPGLEALFFSQRLDEAIVKPMYSSTEQLIFSEQVKKIKE